MRMGKDILELQVAVPFRPFKMHLSDGRIVSIEHPEKLLVYRNSIVVAQRDKNGELPERGEKFSILHITSLDGVETP
jgi:hypothetical protein